MQHLDEINQLEEGMQHKKDAMVKARKDYVKAWKEAQAAHAKHMKADHNMDISRAELEKARHNALSKGQASEDAKNNYAHVLQVANQQQTMHYAELLPTVLEVCSTCVCTWLKCAFRNCAVSTRKACYPLARSSNDVLTWRPTRCRSCTNACRTCGYTHVR